MIPVPPSQALRNTLPCMWDVMCDLCDLLCVTSHPIILTLLTLFMLLICHPTAKSKPSSKNSQGPSHPQGPLGPNNGAHNGALGVHGPSASSHVTGERLVLAVQMLQQTILDVYLLFFKTDLQTSASGGSGGVSGAGGGVSGLVLMKQLEFISDIDRALSPLLPPSAALSSSLISSLPSSLSAPLSALSSAISPLLGTPSQSPPFASLQFDRVSFLNDDRLTASPLAMKNIFDSWVTRAVQRVGERAKVALGNMDSATEVARLQHRVWLGCTTVTLGETGETNVWGRGYRLWESRN